MHTMTSLEKMLCLAMTVLGPLTSGEGELEGLTETKDGDSESGLSSLLGRSVASIFTCVEWSTIRALSSAFGSLEHCLHWLSVSFAIPEADMSRIKAGAELLKEWQGGYEEMTKDLDALKKELERTRAQCTELSVENAHLRQKCETYSEAGEILEQDRQQLQSLLTDKCKLLEENHHLEREISSLQELLEYATEHAVEEADVDGETQVEYADVYTDTTDDMEGLDDDDESDS